MQTGLYLANTRKQVDRYASRDTQGEKLASGRDLEQLPRGLRTVQLSPPSIPTASTTSRVAPIAAGGPVAFEPGTLSSGGSGQKQKAPEHRHDHLQLR